MEDAHATILDLQSESDEEVKPATEEDRLSFFGVYDGHGGDKVALFAGEHIHKIVAKQEAFKKGDLEQALKDGFLATDRAILNGQQSQTHMRRSLIADNFQTRVMKRKSLVAPQLLASSLQRKSTSYVVM